MPTCRQLDYCSIDLFKEKKGLLYNHGDIPILFLSGLCMPEMYGVLKHSDILTISYVLCRYQGLFLGWDQNIVKIRLTYFFIYIIEYIGNALFGVNICRHDDIHSCRRLNYCSFRIFEKKKKVGLL